MGWIRSAKNVIGLSLTPVFQWPKDEQEPTVTQIEYSAGPCLAENKSQSLREKWPTQPIHKPDSELPFISPALVRQVSQSQQTTTGRTATTVTPLWIVVDDIVYDCSEFLDDHPGGQQVILSFVGQDCSWQFWRFHSRDIIEEHGRPLRVGRTEGIENRFKEFPRYIGLSKLGDNEDFYC